MAIPKTFAPVKKQDFTLKPVKMYKPFTITSQSFLELESGYALREGRFSQLITPVSAAQAENDPINPDGSYMHIIWKQIDHMYYRNPHNMYETMEHSNPRYTYKMLHPTASLLSFPYLDYGLKIKPGTVEITNSTLGITLKDDGYGNLYDQTIESMSYVDSQNWELYDSASLTPPSRFKFIKNLYVIDLNFNQLFRRYKYGRPDSRRVSYSGSNDTFFKNIKYVSAKHTSGYINHEGAISFHDSGSNDSDVSYIRIPNNDKLNFDKLDEYSISFNIRPYSDGEVLSKNSMIDKIVYGWKEIPTSDDTMRRVRVSHRDFVHEPIDIYPYKFYISQSLLYFEKSDGLNTLQMSQSISTGSWNRVNLIRAYYQQDDNYHIIFNVTDNFTDLELTSSLVDNLKESSNKYDVMIGDDNLDTVNSFEGDISNIKITREVKKYPHQVLEQYLINNHNAAYEADPVAAWSTYIGFPWLIDEAYKYDSLNVMPNSIVGNVFYKTGNVVFSPQVHNNTDMTGSYSDEGYIDHYKKYDSMFSSGSWTVSYESTHLAYRYEVLCRINKGDFNLSMNPTARKTVKSDELIDEITGSLLNPYATTVGMYNDKGDLIAVGKLAQAVAMRDDVDINILVAWDA